MSFWGHEPCAMIDADTAASEIEQGAQLIDVGQPDDWFAGHMPHAKLVDTDLADDALKELAKDKPVVVAAHDDDIARGFADLLRDHGFQVAVLERGPAGWKASGRKLIKADGTEV